MLCRLRGRWEQRNDPDSSILTYAIPETDSDDLILAGTTNYKHPAIIDMFTK